MKHYRVNEIFYSLQGEGVRAGTPNVFVRFSGCNLTCNGSVQGEAFAPICDTEFMSGRPFTAADIYDAADALWPKNRDDRAVIFTGGEPGLQLDKESLVLFTNQGWHTAIETNGTQILPFGIDWVTVSPKTAEHTLVVDSHVEEVKYVRQAGQGIPKTRIKAAHYCISPAFGADGTVSKETLSWCIRLVTENPPWRLSMQLHKFWSVR